MERCLTDDGPPSPLCLEIKVAETHNLFHFYSFFTTFFYFVRCTLGKAFFSLAFVSCDSCFAVALCSSRSTVRPKFFLAYSEFIVIVEISQVYIKKLINGIPVVFE